MSAMPGSAADAAHRLIAVHVGHHDVDQRGVDVGCGFQDGDALGAAFGVQHLDVMRLEHAGQRVDVADVVVDDEDPAARRVRGSRSRSSRPRRAPRGGLPFLLAARAASAIDLEQLRQLLARRPAFRSRRPRRSSSACAACSAPEMTCTGMSAVSRDRAAAGRAARTRRCRQAKVERDRAGPHLADHRHRPRAGRRDDPLEARPWASSSRMPANVGSSSTISTNGLPSRFVAVVGRSIAGRRGSARRAR